MGPTHGSCSSGDWEAQGVFEEGLLWSRELSEALGEREEQIGELMAHVAELDADRERLWTEAQHGLALSAELAGMTRQFQASKFPHVMLLKEEIGTWRSVPKHRGMLALHALTSGCLHACTCC